MKTKILFFTVIFSYMGATLCLVQEKPSINIIPNKENTAACYIFCHGLGGNQRQAYYYARDNSVLGTPLALFNFPDVKNDSSAIHTQKVNLGQELDIATLNYVYQEAAEQFPAIPCILAGVSRGAATILNFLATNSDPSIAAAIVESPFDTLHTVLAHQIELLKLQWIPGFHNACMAFARFWWFPLVDMKGIFPLQSVKNISTNLPILFIHSAEDELIPTQCSRNLFHELVSRGNTNVYYLELTAGKHANVINGPQGHIYKQVVHAFYKKYNLPHSSELALLGEPILAQCQPVIRI